jgi:hypothetical protein
VSNDLSGVVELELHGWQEESDAATTKQLWSLSRDYLAVPYVFHPAGTVFDHGIQYGEQLAHTSSNSYFREFSRDAQAAVKVMTGLK